MDAGVRISLDNVFLPQSLVAKGTEHEKKCERAIAKSENPSQMYYAS